ncbi:MAG: hypothetical protein AAGA29_01890 [Planctomycetota bacterium]
MHDANTHLKPWRCLNCREHVDPTMALCWNCGYDREGVAQPAMFVDEVDVDTSVCATCLYDLKGNPDATACPECGEPVPWADCDVCGVRSSRSAMAYGCPACKATVEKRAFKPEVQRYRHTHCPSCRSDLRQALDAKACPDCGVTLPAESYDTPQQDAPILATSADQMRLSKHKRIWFIVCLLMILPGFPLAAAMATWLHHVVSEQAGTGVIAFWCIFMLVSIINFLRALCGKLTRHR